jgi:hypothetical protein
MRTSRLSLGLALAVIVVVCITVASFVIRPSPYLRFMHRDIRYYSEVAHACDAIMAQHPASSTDSVALSGHMVLPYTLKVSGSDPSLPEIIRALHADHILVSTNRVFIDIPPERMGGFGVIWERDEMRTNHWTLQSNGDGLVKTVYEESRL